MNKEHKLEIIIGVLALISIVVIVLLEMVSLHAGWLWGLYILDLIICIFFAWDFIRRALHSPDKRTFLKCYGYEINRLFSIDS